MPAREVPVELLQQALDWQEEFGSCHLTVRALGKKCPPKTTLEHRVKIAALAGMRAKFLRESPRIHTSERLGKMHLVIPDVQMKPGVRNDHMEWVGNYIVEKKPDTIICIGDFADMSSLCIYEKGKLPFEGRRYVNDVKAVRTAMDKLLKPLDDYNRTAKKKYTPRKVMTLGNHEDRITRVVNANPEYADKFDLEDLGYRDYGWEVHPFLKVVEIDGIQYAHYFTSGVMGRPASSAAVVLRERQQSATMGHVQHTDIAMHKKTQQIALFCGTCYLHDEEYLGQQGNNQRRQIVVKHEVEEGRYDPMFVSLKFLGKAYA
jgi:calcineurin-like phosphoesterase family protein